MTDAVETFADTWNPAASLCLPHPVTRLEVIGHRLVVWTPSRIYVLSRLPVTWIERLRFRWTCWWGERSEDLFVRF